MSDNIPTPPRDGNNGNRFSLRRISHRLLRVIRDVFFSFVRIFDPELAVVLKVGWLWHFIAAMSLLYMYVVLPGQLEATIVAVGYFTLARLLAFVTSRSMLNKPTDTDPNSYPMLAYNGMKVGVLIACLLFFALRV